MPNDLVLSIKKLSKLFLYSISQFILFNSYIMEQGILATVNINIGLGRQNPALIIREGDHIPTLVNRLIDDYQLPKKVYAIIMQKVAQQLPTPPPSKSIPKEALLKTGKMDRHLQANSTKQLKTLTPKNIKSRQLGLGKQNNRNGQNITINEQKYHSKKSLSPFGKTSTTPTIKKIQIKNNKSLTPNASNPPKQFYKSVKLNDGSTQIKKIFKYLTKHNPSHIHILSHQHINLKGMDRELLSVLQQFFESIDQNEFDLMTQGYFLSRVQQLGFKKKMSKKQYEYCYNY